jgi:iron complex outermembrane receptor protein
MKSSVALIGLALTLPALAAAQGTPDSTKSLPGMTVTATRNPAPILKTPLAVSKITAPDLHAVSGFGLDEALRTVPGVIARSRYGTSDIQLIIRGFGARGAGDRSNAGTSRGVRVLIDGFPETEPDGRTPFDQVDLAAADAVEVIRSNASSMWGNAAGGVVNVLTMPTASQSVFELQPVFGGDGLARYAARASMPVDGGALFGSFTNTSYDGFRAHSSSRRALLNGGAVGLVGNDTRLGVYVTAANTLMHLPGPLTQAQFDADPTQANAGYVSRDERRYNRTGRLGISVEHDFDKSFSISSNLFVNPKYQQRSERNTYRDFNRYHIGGNLLAHKDLMTGTMRSRFTVGLDEAYQDGTILFYNLSPTQGRGTTLTDNKGEGANNFGIIAQDELSVNDRLSLLLGARYDAIAYYFRSFLPTPPVRTDSRNYERVSPKLGVNWMLSSTHSVYANVGGGIEVPAQNESDPTPGAPPALLNPLLEPILSTTYEVGMKAVALTFGSNAAATLGYDLALYDAEITNDAIPYNSGRYYLTASKGRRMGAELGVNLETRAGIFGSGALTLSRNRYLDYVIDSTVIFPTDPTKVGKFADYSGNDVVGLPPVLAHADLGTTVPGMRGLRLKIGVDHSGDYFADDANAVTVPGFTTLSLTVESRNPILSANGWGVRGFVTVQNLTDRKYVASAYLNPDLVGGAPAAYEPGAPRTVIVSLTAGRLH